MDNKSKLTFKNVTRILAFIFFPILFAFLSFLIMIGLFNLAFHDYHLFENVFIHNTAAPTYNKPTNVNFKTSTNSSNNPLSLSEISFPHYGQTYGNIEIQSVNINCPLIYGDDSKLLNEGACQYTGSFIPGYSGTTLISAHNTRVFRTLKKVMNGDLIKVSTSYGVYVYKVTTTAIMANNDETAYDLSSTEPSLILYTCYKENVLISNVAMRYFVYANFVSGPLLKNQ